MKIKKDKKTEAEQTPEQGKAGKKIGWIVALIVALALVGAAVTGAAVAGKNISRSDTNLPNVYVGEINVGGLTQEETLTLLTERGWDQSVSGTLTVTLPMNVSARLDYINAGASLTAEGAAAAAYRYGHDGSSLDSLKAYLHSMTHNEDVSQEKTTLDAAYINEQLSGAISRFAELTADTGYTLDEKNAKLLFLKGAGEMKIDAEALFDQAAEALLRHETELSYILPDAKYTMPDFKKLHKELSVETADAYYDPETETIIPDVKGVDFDVDEAERLWKAAAATETVAIPMTLTLPGLTAETLAELLFRDKLGERTTYYWGSTADRINNIDLAAEKLNGLVLLPGDEFSYNGYVGQRTEEAGFKAAAAYDNGKVVQEIGGGICQVSSTLYCATLAANLETVSRTNHYFAVGYLDKGLDATVSWPNPDFKFRNNRDYPIKIVATSDHSQQALTIEIWGSNLDGTYVVPVSSWWPTYDNTYPTVQVGWGAASWRYVYDADGDLIDEIYEDGSLYYLHDEDIQWPEEPEETDEPEPSDTPAPTPTPDATEPPDDDVVVIG